MQGIKAVFFDIDNTLLDFDKCAVYAIEQAFNDCGLKFDNSYSEVFFKINKGLWLDIEKKVITFEQLQKIRFNKVFEALNISYDGTITEARFRYHLKDAHFVVDGAVELVEYLAQKYDLYVASNAVYFQQLRRLENAGMLKYFKQVFVSENIGFSKPTKEFFSKCFEKVENASAEQTVMIGDSLTADILGATNFGMKSIWFNIEKKSVPDNVTADYIVSELLQIKKIL
jgi:2-haloacid dehalogenase/putative hydrolase of the HAD superfamily